MDMVLAGCLMWLLTSQYHIGDLITGCGCGHGTGRVPDHWPASITLGISYLDTDMVLACTIFRILCLGVHVVPAGTTLRISYLDMHVVPAGPLMWLASTTFGISYKSRCAYGAGLVPDMIADWLIPPSECGCSTGRLSDVWYTQLVLAKHTYTSYLGLHTNHYVWLTNRKQWCIMKWDY